MMPAHADPKQMLKHWMMLCGKIGRRYAGTDGERDAAEYITEQFERIGLANVTRQLFEFPGWDYQRCDLTLGRSRRRITKAVPMEYSVSTPGGARGVSGEVVYLQGGSELDFTHAGDIRGKIGLVIGSQSLGDPAFRGRVESSGIVALLLVDERIPYAWKTPIGAAPQWTVGYTVPTVAIPFGEAVELVRELPLRATLRVQASASPAQSSNVIGEVPGSDRPDEVIVVSAHHDCVRGTVGANDNASGCVFVLEMARILRKKRLRRTVRFVTFGVEERLSVGSYHYMRTLGEQELQRIIFAVNADGLGSTVGTDVVRVTGTTPLQQLVEGVWKHRVHAATIHRCVAPYSDHFPFNIAGVPSLWLGRPNMLGQFYWNLHSRNDNLKHISTDVLGRTVDTARELIEQVANADDPPFTRRIDDDLARDVRRLAESHYHHPRNVADFDYERFR